MSLAHTQRRIADKAIKETPAMAETDPSVDPIVEIEQNAAPNTICLELPVEAAQVMKQIFHIALTSDKGGMNIVDAVAFLNATIDKALAAKQAQQKA